MIVGCPKCRVRYRLEDSRVTGDSAKLRCPKCQAIFIARKETATAQMPGPGISADATLALPASKTPRTALLADEPREFRDFVAGVLGEAGFEVGMTDNGEEALLLAGGHCFDLILLNVYLRRMLGINVCERLKSEPATRDTPVLLIGALVRQEEGGLPRGLYGADDFLPTSIGRQELLDRIGRWVPHQAGPVSPARLRRDCPARTCGRRIGPDPRGGRNPPTGENHGFRHSVVSPRKIQPRAPRRDLL